MRNSVPQLSGCALLAAIAGTTALAHEPSSPPQQIEVGAGWVSDESARFGRYNDLDSDGAYFLGNIDLRLVPQEGYYGKIRGTDLGLDSRYFRLDGGKQGSFNSFLEYSQLNVHNADDGVTPFTGGSTLQLPGDWIVGSSTADMPSLDGSLHPLTLGTERKRFGLGFSALPAKYWNVGLSYHREEKNGLAATGASMAYRSSAAILPAPVDYTTDEVQAVVAYARNRGQFEIKYRMSLFSNDHRALTWDNPYLQGAETGSLALPPDNQYHQISLSGGYRLAGNVRVTGMLATALMTQNENFLPYATTAGLTGPLPRNDLNGKVWVTTGRFGINARPSPKWNYNLALRYYERDNQTPRNTYEYVITDLFPGGISRNQSYGYQQQKANARIGYRLTTRTRVSLDYTYDDTSRDRAEVDGTREHTLKASLRTRLHNKLNGSLYLAGSKRDQSGAYNALSRGTNADLRVSYLAKRDETKAGLSLNYMPTESLSFNGSADYVQDKYTDTKIGLRRATHPTYSLDMAFNPQKDLSTYAYYTYDGDVAKQQGSRSGDLLDWTARTDDTSNTIGVGLKWAEVVDDIDVGADYVYNRSKSNVKLAADGENPDLVNRMKSLRLFVSYHLKQDLQIKLGYRHERYSSSDWAIDGITPTTIDQVLGLATSSPDYNQDVYMLSFIKRLD